MTLGSNDRQRLKRILDLSDRLGALRRNAQAPATAERREEVREIAARIATIGLPGTLGRLAEEQHLSPQEVLVVLTLLQKRVEGGRRSLTGRQVLSLLFPSVWGVLSGAALLGADGALRRSGSIVVEEPELPDPLESRFRIADPLYRAVESEVQPRRVDTPRAEPYQSHYEHLAEVGTLANLLLRRSNAIFEVDPFGHRAFDDPEDPGVIDARAELLRERVRTRLALTPEGNRYPLVRLARRMKLSEDEQLILVSLLVQECYYGNPGLEAVDCVKMVSKNTEELLRKRSLMDSVGTLVGEGLVELNDPMDERELSAEATLPRWVVCFLLDEEPQADRRPIGADTRLEFHEYLKRLGDSDQFFRDLDR